MFLVMPKNPAPRRNVSRRDYESRERDMIREARKESRRIERATVRAYKRAATV